jgi:hypothetical protein
MFVIKIYMDKQSQFKPYNTSIDLEYHAGGVEGGRNFIALVKLLSQTFFK